MRWPGSSPEAFTTRHHATSDPCSRMIAPTCLAVVFVPSFYVVLQNLDIRLRGRKKPDFGDGTATEPAKEPAA